MRNTLLVLAAAIAFWFIVSFEVPPPSVKGSSSDGLSTSGSFSATPVAAGAAPAVLKEPLPPVATVEPEIEVAQSERSSADPGDVDWRRKALDYIGRTDAGNDLGHRAVLQILKRFVDGGCQMVGVAGAPAPKPEDVESSPEINPTGHKLSSEEKVQLSAILSDFAERRQVAKSDLYIATQIETSLAIIAGDFETHPQLKPGESNVDVMRQVREASAKYFDNPRDENINSVPGVDGSTYRIIVLKPRTAPGYISVKRRLRVIDAEEGLALRSFFFPVGPTRR